MTVFLTVLSGVLVFVLGQLLLKLVIEPVNEMRKTIGAISHALIEHAGFIHNPGVMDEVEIDKAATELRRLSSQLQSHMYLVPYFDRTVRIFRLPDRKRLLRASHALLGLSNSLHRKDDRVYETNAKRVEKICDSLSIYFPDESRWPEPRQSTGPESE
jgi:hypothetical protein